MKKKKDLFDILWEHNLTKIILIIGTYEMYKMMFVKFMIEFMK